MNFFKYYCCCCSVWFVKPFIVCSFTRKRRRTKLGEATYFLSEEKLFLNKEYIYKVRYCCDLCKKKCDRYTIHGASDGKQVKSCKRDPERALTDIQQAKVNAYAPCLMRSKHTYCCHNTHAIKHIR